jgi:hypothetical protein
LKFAFDQHPFFSMWYHCAEDKTSQHQERSWHAEANKFRIAITHYELGGNELRFEVTATPSCLGITTPGATSILIHAVVDQLPAFPHFSSQPKARVARLTSEEYLDDVFLVAEVLPELMREGEHALALDWSSNHLPELNYIRWKEYSLNWGAVKDSSAAVIDLLTRRSRMECYFLFACQDPSVVTESSFHVNVWKTANYAGWIDFWYMRTRVCHAARVIQTHVRRFLNSMRA